MMIMVLHQSSLPILEISKGRSWSIFMNLSFDLAFLIVEPKIKPDKVEVTDGIIKYDLGHSIYCFIDEPTNCMNRPDGSGRLFAKHRKENVDSSYEGVVLLQMLENRLLKVEVFPGNTSSEIEKFTSNATIYER